MRTSAIAAIAIFAVACTNTISVNRPLETQSLREINSALADKPAEVFASGTDADPIASRSVTVGADSTSVDDGRSLPTAAIDRIIVYRRGLGALEGLGFGFLGGVAGGALIGQIAASGADPDCNNSAGCLYPIIGAAIGGLLGVLAGPIIGAVIGHRTTIEFAHPGVPANREVAPEVIRSQDLMDRILHRNPPPPRAP